MSRSAVGLGSIPTVAQLFKQGHLKAASAQSSLPSYSGLSSRISLYQGDITQLHVDAIVNAANETLLGGGGVDGAIHRAAGAELKQECKKLNGCKTGDAKSTNGNALPASNVIHTVGPIYAKGRASESESALRSAYTRSLEEAVKINARSVAFPSISTGVYGYPIQEATNVALESVGTFLDSKLGQTIETVIFCVFSQRDYNIYANCIPQHFASS